MNFTVQHRRLLGDMGFDCVSYGYLVWANGPVPDELKPAKKLARNLNCIWLRFDYDGDKVEELPQWVW
jgi:hypothetical protein